MAEKKIALIIAGGVSLGSFEAGALTEIMYALDTLNSMTNGDTYKIDIMTGGSAGSITGAISTRIMMHNYQQMKHTLHNVWVELVDIDDLMVRSDRGALLSNNIQRTLAEKYIINPEVPKGESASFAADTIHLSFTLSNLVGIDFTIPYKNLDGLGDSGKRFVSTEFKDFSHFAVNSKNADSAELWQEISDSVIASGSFPVAFAPYKLYRRYDHYPGADINYNKTLPGNFLFYDGGLFNNEPLKRAIDLASRIDGGAISADRTFILVDPNMNKSKVKPEFTEEQGLLNNVKGLAAMLVGQTGSKDWMKVSDYNMKIQWTSVFIDELKSLVEEIDESDLQLRKQQTNQRVEKILDKKAEQETVFNKGEYRKRKLHDIEYNYQLKLVFTKGNQQSNHIRKQILMNLIFLTNLASGYTSKSRLNLGVIGADREKVAGDAFFAFAGFFDKNWREHDCRIGRQTTHDELKRILKVDYPKETDDGGDDHNRFYDIEKEWSDFKDKEFKDTPKYKREKLGAMVEKNIDQILKEDLKLNFLIRSAARYLLVKRILRKFLHL